MLYFRLIVLFTLIFSFVSHANSNFIEVFNKHSAVMLLIEPSTGNIVSANAAAHQFYGLPKRKLESLSIQDINQLSEEQVTSEMALAKSENRKHFIFRHKTGTNETKTVAVHSVPVVVNNEKFLFSIIQDITAERKFKSELWHYQSKLEASVERQVNQLYKNKKEHTLTLALGVFFLAMLVVYLIYLLKRKNYAEEQRTVLSQIVEQSPVSIETTDANGVITYVNKCYVDGSGFKLSEVVGKKPNIMKSGFHNTTLYDDLWITITNGKHWVGEFYNKRKNGQTYWARANIYPLKNTKNEITSYVAIKEDITQLKEDEKELRLASTVFQTATEAVMITDTDNLIIAVNQAFTVITGYQEAEVLGKNPELLSSGHHDDDFYKEMNNELSTLGKWQGEICNRRKNGEVYYEWLSITALKNKLGEVESYVALFSDITKRKKAEDKIYHQANYDSLTGLANRNLFLDRFDQSVSVASRDKKSIALLFIDLDGFKSVNDNFGHSKGDLLLKHAAQRIKNSVRTSDSVARLSGDEFAIMLCGDNDVYSNEKVATKILKELAAPFLLAEKEARVTASIGIAIFPDDGHLSEDLLGKADSAMYKAKQKGKNNIQFFTKEMDIKAQQHRKLEIELRKSIINDELVLYYQPIHELQTGKVVSAEALIRWIHPDKGLISPIKFIPLAEDIGFIVDIGDWVLAQACKQAKIWQDEFECPPKISVNISAAQLHRPDFIDKLSKELTKSKLSPALLTLEMTESLLIKEDIHTLAKLQKIRDIGIDISIDDFGTGYSSLSYLKRFPINILKIDREFIKDIITNKEDESLTCAILSIAETLNLKVVAEGVEDKAQCDMLAKHDCQFVQGYFFSKPIKAEAFGTYISDHC